jgi:hypothetical protein
MYLSCGSDGPWLSQNMSMIIIVASQFCMEYIMMGKSRIEIQVMAGRMEWGLAKSSKCSGAQEYGEEEVAGVTGRGGLHFA